jgi:hypothetical protein
VECHEVPPASSRPSTGLPLLLSVTVTARSVPCATLTVIGSVGLIGVAGCDGVLTA